MLGFRTLDLNASYFDEWHKFDSGEIPTSPQGLSKTGVMFSFTYQYVRQSQLDLVQSFALYLNSIGMEQDTVPGQLFSGLYTPALTTLAQESIGSRTTSTMRARSELAYRNQTLFGIVPTPGYTLFIADLNTTYISVLPAIPSV